ncbi:MAG: hypothetical protein IJH69_02205, partial [Firmicutes bacterium]|nr:hypothetical protein [Bacillota bacterium]
ERRTLLQPDSMGGGIFKTGFAKEIILLAKTCQAIIQEMVKSCPGGGFTSPGYTEEEAKAQDRYEFTKME